ncbi:hypothetical protein ABPG77_002332 [Micractinium sp. CCAP 211/92]
MLTLIAALTTLQGAAADAPLPPVCTAPPPGAECGPFVDATCAAIFSEPRQGVDNTAGYLASLLAQIATWEDTADALLRTWGCTATHFISEHVADQTDTQVAVADSPTTVFVFFRGTETTQRADIATDLDTTLKAVPGLGNLHNGFFSAYEAVHTQLSARVSQFLGNMQNKRVVFAGHSLGGALANIAAARQEQAQPGSVGGVYTYVRRKDPVPLVPPHGGKNGFEHVYLNNTECMADVDLQPYCDGHKIPLLQNVSGPLAGLAVWLNNVCDGKPLSTAALDQAIKAGLEAFKFPPTTITAKELVSLEPSACCSAVDAHSLDGYIAFIKNNCLDTCEAYRLCMCESYFQRNQGSEEPPLAPSKYDTAAYTITVKTACDTWAGTSGGVKAYLEDGKGGRTETWTLNEAGRFKWPGTNNLDTCTNVTIEGGTSDWLDPADWQLVVQFEGGFAQNWKPEYIRVANDSGGSRTFCLFKQGPTASGWLTASGSYAFVPCSPPAQQTAGVTSAMDSAHPEL